MTFTAGRRVRPVHALLSLVCAVVMAMVGTGATARAAGVVTLTGYGADSCTAPSVSQMQTYWNDSPYSYWPIYIGGVDRACSQPNLTSSWVSAVLKQGWSLLPLWVGLQNPCNTGQTSYFSRDTSTAYTQGTTEAHSAYEAWLKLSSVTSFPVAYDIEAPSTNSSTCRAAAESFINGWDHQLHLSPAQTAGVYTSSCAGDIDDFSAIANKPDFVYAADYDGIESVNNVSCLPSSHWDHSQRHKQYQGGHNVTYGGVTLNVDSDCANGPVYGNTTRAPHPGCDGSSGSAAAIRSVLSATAPVLFSGSVWSVGGPLNSQLLRDGVAVNLSGLTRARHNVSPAVPSVATPVVLADGELVVPVTTHLAGTARELLYTSTNGRHFTERTSIPLTMTPNPGVALSVAAQTGSQVYFPDPNGNDAWVWSPSGLHTVAVTGLTADPESMTFASLLRGSATVEMAPTRASRPHTQVLSTTDGGRTWR